MITFRKSPAIVLILLGGLALVSLSCNLSITTPTPQGNMQVVQSTPLPPIKTITPENLETATQETPASPISLLTSNTTATPTSTLATPTSRSVTETLNPSYETPIAIALVDINIRSGPGQQFPVVGNLYENDQAIILGKAFGLEWWKINCPSNIISSGCWITSNERYTSAQLEESVPEVDPPPTPTPKPEPKEKPEKEPKDEPPCTGYDCTRNLMAPSIETIKDVFPVYVWLMLGMVVGWFLVLFRKF